LNGSESKLISLDAVVKTSGLIDVVAELEDDDIIYDNKRYSNLFIPSEIPVIIFSDEESDSRFAEIALSASGKDGSLKVTRKNINQVSSFDLSKYEVIIVIGSEKIKDYEKLNSFVLNGGGLFLLPGSKSTLNNFNSLIKSFNLNPASGEAGQTGNYSNTFSFGVSDLQHPLFQNIFSDQNKKKIESPEIYHYFKINPSTKGETIVPMVDGSAFLSEFKSGSGKIFVLNTAPVLSWNSLPLKSIFVPLINKSVFYLAQKDRNENEYIAGENINLKVQALPQLKIEKPDKVEDFINIDTQNKNFVEYSNTNTAGNYKIYSGSSLIDLVSINSDPLESRTEYLEEADIEEYFKEINFGGTFIIVDGKENPAEIILQARFGSELWKFFLIVALILILAEMAIARNSKKELVEVT
jgi:hypothetical protein